MQEDSTVESAQHQNVGAAPELLQARLREQFAAMPSAVQENVSMPADKPEGADAQPPLAECEQGVPDAEASTEDPSLAALEALPDGELIGLAHAHGLKTESLARSYLLQAFKSAGITSPQPPAPKPAAPEFPFSN